MAIGSINSSTSSDGWAQLREARAATQGRIQNRLLDKVDSDASGGIDSSELQTALDRIAEKSGTAIDTSATDLLAKADGNGDGSLDGAELEKALGSVLPPPSTMDFAQSRAADTAKTQAGEDLFAKVDADGSGSIDKRELTALMDAMAKSDTASANDGLFTRLDTNADGSLTQAEFEAGRPSGGQGGRGGMPPPASSGGSDSTTYDPLDTNRDGVVSALELAAGSASAATSADPLAALFKAVDADGDEKLSASETDALLEQVTTALETLQKASDTGTSGGSTSDSKGGEDKPFDLRTLAQLVLKQYEDIAKNQSSTANTTLSATA